MKTIFFSSSIVMLVICSLFSSCTKDEIFVSQPSVVIGQVVSDSVPLNGSIKGTMLTGKTYTMDGDITINIGDTLFMQHGVTLKVGRGLTILVKGVFVSLGSQSQPNWIVPIDNITKIDEVGTTMSSDSAYCGYWTGINCEPSCTLLDLKWTHIEYTGANFGATLIPIGKKAGDTSAGILFQNTTGDFIMEDSWMYGSCDDAIRISTGRLHVMRNTYEKCGRTGGDCVNVKSGGVGDIAYNLFVGTATNGSKAANKGGSSVQTNVNMYNNTYISGGYRQKDPTGRGASINYEEGAKGKVFNNLLINCKVGVRISNNPAADVENLTYGYNYSYGDSLSVCNMIYPVAPTGTVTVPQPTDMPTPTDAMFPPEKYSQTYLYTKDANGNLVNMVTPYDASSWVGVGNPQFDNFPLPTPNIKHLSDISAVGHFSFRLSPSSPALGKGTSDAMLIAPLAAIQVTDELLRPSEITLPGSDPGCYQSNGIGNQH